MGETVLMTRTAREGHIKGPCCAGDVTGSHEEPREGRRHPGPGLCPARTPELTSDSLVETGPWVKPKVR